VTGDPILLEPESGGVDAADADFPKVGPPEDLFKIVRYDCKAARGFLCGIEYESIDLGLGWDARPT
jgi:hypothetical protein